MAIKVIKPNASFAAIVWIAAAVVVIAFGFVAARSFFIDTLATRLDIRDPAAEPIVDALTQSAPANPNVHVLAGVYYEKTFDVADLDRSLAEYERAAELAPSNYTLWLGVAEARDRLGDSDAAEAAFKRSLELAPNYADVQWAYGNFLVRQGHSQEGFRSISQAARADPTLAGPAVSLVVQITNGDIAATRALLGNDPTINSALATTLASLKRYDDALNAWQAIPPEVRKGEYHDTATALMSSFLGATQFRAAAMVAGDLAEDDAAKPAIGQVTNGGFENGVKLRNAGPFEWQITEGSEPQIGLSEGQRRSGRYGLTVVFNTFRGGEGSREISQQMAVEPGARYRLDAWYRGSVKTDAKFQWELVDSSGKVTATTPVMSPADNWTEVSAEIAVPAGSDGVRVILLRTGCTSATCPATGTLVFDDISLTKE